MILYQMLCGELPFDSEKGLDLVEKIIEFRHSFRIPEECASEEAKNLLKKLICDQEIRIGSGIHLYRAKKGQILRKTKGFKELQRQPFFDNLNFATLRDQRAPFEGEVENMHEKDNSSLKELKDVELCGERVQHNATQQNQLSKNIHLTHYSYRRFESSLNTPNPLLRRNPSLSNLPPSH